MKHDLYLLLLAVAVAIELWAADGAHQPKRLRLVPVGIAVALLAVLLRAAGLL